MKTQKKVSKKKARSKTAVKKKPTSGLQIGQVIPSIRIVLTGNQEIDLRDLKGKKIVLYFYPKDSTPGCTVEGKDFSRLKAKFAKKNAIIFGVSRDSLASHEKFKTNQCFQFDLISDPEEELCTLFGVIKEKNLYGRKYMGIDRSTFIIDEKGVLQQEWRGVKVPGHAEEVLGSL